MQITRPLFFTMTELFRDDPANLGNVAASYIRTKWINAPFTPGPDLVVGDLSFQELEVFNNDNNAITGTTVGGRDPVTGDQFFVLVPDELIWQIITTGLTTPFTIYGVALTFNDDTILVGTMALPAPVTFDGNNQAIVFAEIGFHMPPSMVR